MNRFVIKTTIDIRGKRMDEVVRVWGREDRGIRTNGEVEC